MQMSIRNISTNKKAGHRADKLKRSLRAKNMVKKDMKFLDMSAGGLKLLSSEISVKIDHKENRGEDRGPVTDWLNDENYKPEDLQKVNESLLEAD